MTHTLDTPTMADVDVIRVEGGARLAGEVRVVGAKNSALKLMAAALLAPGRTTITNVPRITDIAIMAEGLRRLGCGVEISPEAGGREKGRCWPAAGSCGSRTRAATRSGRGGWTCTSPASRGWAPRSRASTGTSSRPPRVACAAPRSG